MSEQSEQKLNERSPGMEQVVVNPVENTEKLTEPIAPKPRIWLGQGLVILLGLISATGGAIAGLLFALWQPQSLKPIPGTSITLTADALFAPDDAKLQSQGHQLLDQVASQLGISPQKSLRILSYAYEPEFSGNLTKPINSIQLAYQRAQVIKSYLATRYAPDQKDRQWLVAGYGMTHLLAPSSSKPKSNTQTPNRIEIIVVN
jgi:outer membrane protein OmpA-like peptidoglycan-associated protein